MSLSRNPLARIAVFAMISTFVICYWLPNAHISQYKQQNQQPSNAQLSEEGSEMRQQTDPVHDEGLEAVQSTDGIPTITIEDIHMTVKTSSLFYDTRVPIILDTWFKKTNNRVFFVSDRDSAEMQRKSENHIIPTHCGKTRAEMSLCCKLGAEFDSFTNRTEKWWCRFDDDQYVNPARLIELLNKYDAREEIYLGRNLVGFVPGRHSTYQSLVYHYPYAEGDSGTCITRPLAKRMEAFMSNGKFEDFCKQMNTHDDYGMAFVVHLLGVKLTDTGPIFHCHHEILSKVIDPDKLKEQATFSVSWKNFKNVIPFGSHKPAFNEQEDPTRYYSLHCLLYPDDGICP